MAEVCKLCSVHQLEAALLGNKVSAVKTHPSFIQNQSIATSFHLSQSIAEISKPELPSSAASQPTRVK